MNEIKRKPLRYDGMQPVEEQDCDVSMCDYCHRYFSDVLLLNGICPKCNELQRVAVTYFEQAWWSDFMPRPHITDWEDSGFVYIAETRIADDRDNVVYKIGSAKNVNKRLAQLRSRAWYGPHMELIHTIKCKQCRYMERRIQYDLYEQRLITWQRSELFVIPAHCLTFIKALRTQDDYSYWLNLWTQDCVKQYGLSA